jgi:hypothetical protein
MHPFSPALTDFPCVAGSPYGRPTRNGYSGNRHSDCAPHAERGSSYRQTRLDGAHCGPTGPGDAMLHHNAGFTQFDHGCICESDASPQRGHKVTQTWHQSEQAKPIRPKCFSIGQGTESLPTMAVFEHILRKTNWPLRLFPEDCLVTSVSALIVSILLRIPL